jgi:hypothetical protein
MGSAIAMDQGVLAVGPARDWDLGRDLGPVRLYVRDGTNWREGGDVGHPSGDTQSNFGGALALQAGTLVVGTPCDGARGFQAGAAFVYQRRGARWLLHASLHRPRAMASDLAGSAVAIDERTLVVGVPKADEGALDTGAVEVFELRDDTWVHATTLTAPTPQVGAFFGLSVAIDGNTIFVGSPGDDADGPIAGKVHIYRRTGKAWAWDSSVGCPTGPRGWFGASVTACEGVAAVGAPRAARPGSADARVRGAAWTLQRRNGRWSCDACLIPERAEEGDSIGCSVTTDGRTILLGATADSLRGDLPHALAGGCSAWIRRAAGSPHSSAMVSRWMEHGSRLADSATPRPIPHPARSCSSSNRRRATSPVRRRSRPAAPRHRDAARGSGTAP